MPLASITPNSTPPAATASDSSENKCVHIREAGHQVAATTVNALRTGGNHDPTTDVDDSAVTDEHRDIARDPVAGQRDDVDVCECERSTRGRAVGTAENRQEEDPGRIA